MKLIDYYEYDVPTWALSYLVNGDASGLEDGEQEQVDEWHDDAVKSARRKFPDAASIDLIFRDEDEGSFNRSPAFGLACTTVDAVLGVWMDDGDPSPAFPLPWEDEEE